MMYHLQYRSLKRSLYGNEGIDCKVMGTSHPLADFRFLFVKEQSQVFLFQSFASQNFVDSIHNLKRKVNRLANLWVHLPAAIFQNTTSSHSV